MSGGNGHNHELRELKQGQPAEPTRSWIEFANGETLDCTLVRTGPDRWTAYPPHPVTVRPGDHLRVDALGPGQSIAFADVLSHPADRQGPRPANSQE